MWTEPDLYHWKRKPEEEARSKHIASDWSLILIRPMGGYAWEVCSRSQHFFRNWRVLSGVLSVAFCYTSNSSLIKKPTTSHTHQKFFYSTALIFFPLPLVCMYLLHLFCTHLLSDPVVCVPFCLFHRSFSLIGQSLEPSLQWNPLGT